MQRKQWFTFGLAALATALVFSLTWANSTTSLQPEVDPCILAWDEMTWKERERCAEPYGGLLLAESTIEAIANQTIAARPTISEEEHLATLQAVGEEPGQPTPKPTPVPGIIPDNWEVIEPYRSPTHHLAPGPHWLKYRSGIWWGGAFIAADGYPRRLLLSTHREHCNLFVDVLGLHESGSTHFLEEEASGWQCPEDLGWTTIISVTGPTGIVTLTDELDRIVTFDLTTEEWTLDGEPWLPTATETP